MALVVNTWYELGFTTPIPANNPPWDPALFPAIPFGVLGPILTASSLLAICTATDGTTVSLAYRGGQALTIPDAACIVVATPPMDTTVVGAATWYSIRNGVEWLWYDDLLGQVNYLADSTSLGAFIS